MAKKYYNEQTNVLVVIHADGRTAILGDDTKVTDQQILDMYNGNLPTGWTVAP